MTAENRVATVQIDPYSSEPSKPYGIITADGVGTTEFDDGISVTPLPSKEELYRVNVFSVDTSQLYLDDRIAQMALDRKETVFTYGEGSVGVIDRKPMLDQEITRDLHFSAENGPLSALCVSFTVGKYCPPTDIQIGFGLIEVMKNYHLEQFGGMCRDRKDFQHYGWAAVQLYKHMSPRHVDDEALHHELMNLSRSEASIRGRRLNKAYMLAANNIVARTLGEEQRLALYRTHDIGDCRTDSRLQRPPARYSIRPGRHDTLELDAYARITSPMRRLEDFLNQGQLLLRDTSQQPKERDFRLLRAGLSVLQMRPAKAAQASAA